MRIYRVGQITAYIKELLDSDELLRDLWLEGEISNWRAYSSGHVYFTLKDGEAAINCVIWRAHAARLSFKPRDGDAVLAHGYVSMYEARGTCQLYVDELQKAGAGVLALELERLKKKLEAEGLFDASRKRPLPRFPRRLGVVTSPAGAAWRDICRVLSRRYPLVEVVLAPSAVQGAEAPAQLIAALHLLAQRGDVDVILIARGGGSIEDLWAFNDEQLARAIAACPKPVITGVGHEIDFTIADLVADVRAPTPSAAAEIAVPDCEELRESVDQLTEALLGSMRHVLDRAWRDLHHVEEALRRASPQGMVNRRRQRLDELQRAMVLALRNSLALRRAHLQGLEGRLRPLSPQGTLERGYALVAKRRTGAIVRSVREAPPGEPLRVRVADGEFAARSEEARLGPEVT